MKFKSIWPTQKHNHNLNGLDTPKYMSGERSPSISYKEWLLITKKKLNLVDAWQHYKLGEQQKPPLDKVIISYKSILFYLRH